MATPDMKPICVHIMGHEYALRVRKGEESTTRELAEQVNARMKAFKEEHPEQAELTTSVITALAMAEELNDLRSELESVRQQAQSANEQAQALQQLLTHLSEQMAETLPSGALPVDPDVTPALPSNDDAPEVASASDGHADADVSPPAPALVPGSNTGGSESSEEDKT
ncbi:cell division protein ZapA [Longimonas halophila]|uniref:Cell division protein ZapA n=1 Tax=Longimonas halophila TaxID=1469170 RepID=A0A2H3NNL7_9BACT|nr:cell division protein ZapA [Longimonas halophila]PEN08345.1 cell division protein ZapA [Longimonas halophila]